MACIHEDCVEHEEIEARYYQLSPVCSRNTEIYHMRPQVECDIFRIAWNKQGITNLSFSRHEYTFCKHNVGLEPKQHQEPHKLQGTIKIKLHNMTKFTIIPKSMTLLTKKMQPRLICYLKSMELKQHQVPQKLLGTIKK